MQNFFFDRRSRKRNRRATDVDATSTDERRQQERRSTDRSTLEHYYAVHGMEVDDFSDLEKQPAEKRKP